MTKTTRSRQGINGRLAKRATRTARIVAAAAAAVAAAMATRNASAVTYTYTPQSTATDVWSAGTNWSATPLSAVDTRLTFVGTNTTVLANTIANTNTDDISAAFQLNILDLQGTGPAS